MFLLLILIYIFDNRYYLINYLLLPQLIDMNKIANKMLFFLKKINNKLLYVIAFNLIIFSSKRSFVIFVFDNIFFYFGIVVIIYLIHFSIFAK